jgi:HNH endonuclease
MLKYPCRGTGGHHDWEPFKDYFRCRKCDATKPASRPTISITIQRRTFERQNGHCYYCGVTLAPPKRLGIEATVCCVCNRNCCAGRQSRYSKVFCICGEIDHKIPLKIRGGTNDEENLIWACSYCSHRKGNMTAQEFGDWHGVPLIVRIRKMRIRSRAWTKQLEVEQPDWWRAIHRRQAE